MRHSLHSHILYLEKTIQNVRDGLARPNLSVDEFQDLELQLALAESALTHYRQAYELELSVFGPEPPDQSATRSDRQTDHPENSKPEKKKEGRAASGARARSNLRRRIPIPSRISRPNAAASRAAI